MITITYYRENQPAITVSANRNTVWWKGKSHVMREFFFWKTCRNHEGNQ